MKNAKELLEQLCEQRPIIARQIVAPKADIFILWPQVLRRLGLDTLANNCAAIDFERRQLRLAVRHSVFIQELKLRQNLWLPALEAALKEAGHPHPSVGKISFRVQNPV